MKYLKIFPSEANNHYEGNSYILWLTYLYLLPMAFRTFTHLFTYDAGMNRIASIVIFPVINNLDPNKIIYLLGSLFGGSQMIILLISLGILFKYKSFIPLLWIIFCLDHFMRLLTFTLHYPGSEYTTSNAPGGYIGSLVLLGITSIIFYLSLLRKKDVYGS